MSIFRRPVFVKTLTDPDIAWHAVSSNLVCVIRFLYRLWSYIFSMFQVCFKGRIQNLKNRYVKGWGVKRWVSKSVLWQNTARTLLQRHVFIGIKGKRLYKPDLAECLTQQLAKNTFKKENDAIVFFIWGFWAGGHTGWPPEVFLEPDCVTFCVPIQMCINTQRDGTRLN